MSTINHSQLSSWQDYTQRGAYGHKRMDTDYKTRLCRTCPNVIDPMEDHCEECLDEMQGKEIT